jgi:beta-fructofuranosidase
VLLYDCDDLKAWRFVGVLLDGRDPVAAEVGAAAAAAWECPQLFRATGDDNGDWVLVLSLWNGDPLSVVYLTGTLNPVTGGLAFRSCLGGPVDHGRDWYAPAVLQEEHRVLLWGWSWESRPRREIDAAGWAGLLTFPREVSTHPDGRLRTAPAPELGLLRAAAPFLEVEGVPAGSVPLPDAYELHVAAEEGPAVVELLRGTDGASLTLRLDPGAGRVVLDRSGWPRDRDGHPAESGPLVLPVPVAAGESIAVRVLVDGSVFEVFAGDGHAVATERVYRGPGDATRLAVRAETTGTGAGSAVRVTGWELAPPRNGGSPDRAAA